MAKPTKKIADEVSSRARSLDLYLQKIENLHLSHRDTERAYAGALLEFHAYVERSIERLFLGLLRGRLVSSDNEVRPLIHVNSDKVAIKVVTGERSYVDWLPYERFTLRRAKAFFSRGKPFSILNRTDIEAFEDVTIIRNALAHQSASAISSFNKKLIEGRHIPPNEHRPAAYLRGTYTLGRTRINFLLARTASVMNQLCI